MRLYIDFETRSRLNIRTVGLDRYARNAEVLVCAWAVDDGPLELGLPPMLADPNVVKIAHNCAFERAILKYALNTNSPASEWDDTAVRARYVGLPSSLGEISEVLDLGAEGKADGKRLIAKFSVPKRDGTFRDATTDPEDWQKFVDYCKQDVAAMRVLDHRLPPLPPRERAIWLLDQKINERGIPVDMLFVENAIAIAERERERITRELREATGLENPNSQKQMLDWARKNGYAYGSLGKKFVEAACR